jgi:NADPH:quinone reductase-like Zn-dependent oxidoreductase
VTDHQRIVIHLPGDHRELRIESHASRAPGPGEVAIRVEAVGVNFADCIIRMGLYASAKKLVGWPITPGFEVAGVVEGSDQRVFAVTLFGGYATRVIVPRAQVFPLPDGWSMEQAAGFPTVFLTAWFALFELAHVKPGQTVLVHSAAGGVGQALVQLLKLSGCRVVGVVGSSHKVDAVRALGADVIIDKSREDLWARARELAPKGYDCVLDANGVETLQRSYDHLAPMGKLVIYGFHTMFSRGSARPNWFKMGLDWLRTPRFSPLRMTQDNKSVLAFNLSFLGDRMQVLTDAMGQLLAWVAEGKVRPLPVTAFPFERVADAHAALESGTTTGKVVLTV